MPDVISTNTISALPHWTEVALRNLLIDYLSGVLKIVPRALDSGKTFDTYGLDSIDAVIATGWIGDRLGIDLPPEFLFRHTSIDKVVQALLGFKDADVPALAEPESRAPVLFFAGAGGIDEPALFRFRQHHTQRLTFESVSLGGWRDWIARDLDFETIVGSACQRGEQLVPKGPLLLTGYSQGGQIAYATALMLERSGRTIKFLGLLDSEAPVPEFEQPQTRSFARRAAGGLRLARSIITARLTNKSSPGKHRIQFVARLWPVSPNQRQQKKLRKRIAWFAPILCFGLGGVRLGPFIQTRVFWELSHVWFAQIDSSKRLQAPVVLFRSEAPGSEDRGWRKYCANLTIIPVAGDHHTMLNGERLEQLVHRFNAAVDHADKNAAQEASAKD